MGAIKSWAALAAVTAVVSAVFVSLLPSGKMKNAFSALTGVILLCALISPFSQTGKTSSDIFEDYSALFEENEELYQKKSGQTAVTVAEKGYENAVRQKLFQSSSEPQRVKVKCRSDCTVKLVEITLKEGANEKEVRRAIKEICNDAEIGIKWVKENEE